MSFLNTQLDLYNQGHANKFMSCFGFCRTNGNGGSSQRLLIQNSLSELKVNVQTYEKSLEKAGVSLAAATNPDTNSQYIPVKRSRRNSLVGAARQSLNIKKKAQVIDKALVEELLRNKTRDAKCTELLKLLIDRGEVIDSVVLQTITHAMNIHHTSKNTNLDELLDKAQMNEAEGDHQQALIGYLTYRTLRQREADVDDDDGDTVQLYAELGNAYYLNDSFADADKWYTESLLVINKIYNGGINNNRGSGLNLNNAKKEHPMTAEAYINIASVHRAKGEYNTALEYYEMAKAVRVNAPTLGTNMNHLITAEQLISTNLFLFSCFLR
jgi:tetratricopeptide (TPR) repeat protein